MTNATFIPGRTYFARSACDYDCIFRFEVVRRTAKTVFISYHGQITGRRVRLDGDGIEMIDPMGRFSMSPVLRANRFED